METTITKFLTFLLLPVLSLSAVNPWLPQATQQRGQGVRIKVENNQEVDLYKASYALLIGISDYTNGWPKLPGVKHDVVEVSAVLREHGFVLTTVTNPTWAQLDRAIRDFINEYGQDRDHRLLIYFAGHGHTVETVGGQQGYIVPADAPDPNRNLAAFKNRAVSMDEIDSYVRRIEAKHVLWLFDSCFSGSLFEATRAIPPAITSRTARPVRQFITAGSADQRVPDNSVFRAQFVEGLRGEADRDKDGFITGDELGLYLKDAVTNYTRRAQEPQYGKIRNPNLDKGDFVFSLPRKTETTVTNTAPSGEAAWYREIQNSNDVAELEAFVKAHPNSQYAGALNARIRRLRAAALAANPTTTPTVPPPTNTKLPATRPDPPTLTVDIGNGATMEFQWIPAGSFLMGSPADEKGRIDGEGPQHRVTISQAFYLGKYEVTQRQWQAVMGNNPSSKKQCGANCPVEQVSWEEAQEFIKRLNARGEGGQYRLPTEAEWEYAARAGTRTAYYWGNKFDERYANIGDALKPVGSLLPNAYGVFDMSGNVWEWCSDWYGTYGSNDVTDPQGASTGFSRMFRGGGWYGSADDCRSAYRSYHTPDYRGVNIGFRLVRQ